MTTQMSLLISFVLLISVNSVNIAAGLNWSVQGSVQFHASDILYRLALPIENPENMWDVNK